MLTLSTVQGIIFDVDETLLDTGIGDRVNALHERARLQALHEIGARSNLPELATITPEENLAGFVNAPIHSLDGAVWHILYTFGLVTTETIEPENTLLKEIVARKDTLYETLLRAEGKPVLGAVAFVEWLGTQGFANRMAIASSGIRRDIDIFLGQAGLFTYFPSERIISKENVTHTKPHPEAFDSAFLTLGLPESARGHVLAFEDHARGIMSAKAAGLFTCGITTVSSRAELAGLAVAPDLIADSYAEFQQLLQPK